MRWYKDEKFTIIENSLIFKKIIMKKLYGQ